MLAAEIDVRSDIPGYHLDGLRRHDDSNPRRGHYRYGIKWSEGVPHPHLRRLSVPRILLVQPLLHPVRAGHGPELLRRHLPEPLRWWQRVLSTILKFDTIRGRALTESRRMLRGALLALARPVGAPGGLHLITKLKLLLARNPAWTPIPFRTRLPQISML